MLNASLHRSSKSTTKILFLLELQNTVQDVIAYITFLNIKKPVKTYPIGDYLHQNCY